MSNELDVQNEWEENTHTHGHTYIARAWINRVRLPINSARGQLTGKMNISLSAFAPENLVSRDGFGSPVPRQRAHLHSQAESGVYLTGFLPSSVAASNYLFKYTIVAPVE